MSNTVRSALVPVVIVALLGSPMPSRGQTPATASPVRQTLQAVRTTEPIRLDGVLDDEAWSRTQAGTDFIQRYPDPGKPATMRTEVRIAYDNEAVYVGARMFDPNPDSIAAPLARRDPAAINSDWIDVIFDSYNDRRTGYRFGVNPAGTKLDVYHFNDDEQDDSWDARWDASTRIDSLGWTAELRIPLSQLRFHGADGEQSWGLQFYRAVARRDEWTHWVEYPPTAPGFVSTFGELRGLVGLKPVSPVEITPYVSSSVAAGGDDALDPFRKSQHLGAAAGVDFRVGLGSALSLTGTVNPDFGQVEVDPAVINLSAVETFFPEKRPFFLEGAGIFEFGKVPVHAPYGFSRFVHWRRIGRSPQLSPDADWAHGPDQTTILGAAKLSGQLAGGWSLGVTDAVTQRENARVASVSGERGTALVEPLTNYLVGRAKRDFRDGRASIGALSTAVNRSLDSASASRLRGAAYLAGLDAISSSADRRWTVGGHFLQSLVTGSEAAIAATQTSSARYFNRPDADHLRYDPTLQSLAGHDAAVGLVYQGKPSFGSVQLAETSPGYESNDLGYMSRSDLRSATAAIGTRRNGMNGFVRDGRVMTYGMYATNFAGTPLYRRAGVTSSATFQSLWSASGALAYKWSVFTDRNTRGGPLMRGMRQWEADLSVSTDSRRKIVAGFSGNYEDRTSAGAESEFAVSMTARPTPSLQFSLSPTLSLLQDEAQYIRTVADTLATSTYGKRYIFATLNQRTFSVDTRADWTLTPALSLQLFAQPFRSTARFSGYKELRAPRSFDFNRYGVGAGTVDTLANGMLRVDPDGPGAAEAFTLGGGSNERSFVSRALRVNAVLRWEYRGGSALYLVWQQTRDGDDSLGTFEESFSRMLHDPAKNVLHLKATFLLGR